MGKRTTDATVGLRISNEWEDVDFAKAFTESLVVLSQVQTANDDHWVKTCQRNIAGTGFEVALEEEEAKTTLCWLLNPSVAT